MHHEANPHIIHRDIKASNVLLDADFVPKVADFGFAKLIPDGVSHLTTRVKGTLGYLAPEYAMWGKVSESCDVYSFGVLLLELLTGVQAFRGGRLLTAAVAPRITSAACDAGELVDRRLGRRYDADEAAGMAAVAAACVGENPSLRPSMADVVRALERSV